MMDRAYQGIQAVKDFVWDKYCDHAEQKALQSIAAQRGSGVGDSQACMLCPEDSFLARIEPMTVTHADCTERFDLSCLENWMRSSNQRRTGLEAGDRLKPVSCPACHVPMTDQTVQGLRQQVVVKTLMEVSKNLAEICRVGFEQLGKYSINGQQNQTDKPAVSQEEALTIAQAHIKENAEPLAQQTARKITKALPELLTEVALSQPKHPEFTDARATTMALMMLGEINRLGLSLQNEGQNADLTSLPVALVLYDTFSRITSKYEMSASDSARALSSPQMLSSTSIARNETAAEYVDDAYRATAMVAGQFKAEVQYHLEQAKRYDDLLQSARVGVVSSDDSMSVADRSAAEQQWIDFSNAVGPAKVYTALQNSAQALVTIAEKLMSMHDAVLVSTGTTASTTVAEGVACLNEAVADVEGFLKKLKSHEEGVVQHEDAVNEIVTQLHDGLRGAAETLARQVLAVIDQPAPAVAPDQDIAATHTDTSTNNVTPQSAKELPAGKSGRPAQVVDLAGGPKPELSGAVATRASHSARRLAAGDL